MFRSATRKAALLGVLLLTIPAVAQTNFGDVTEEPLAPVTRAPARPAPPPTPAPTPTIGIMGGEIDGTFMRIATDLTSVMNSDALRVVPIVGKGSLQNIGDLINLKGVDLALVASDALGFAQKNNLYPGMVNKIQYITKLYDNDMHVLAGPDIHSMADLEGKTVNIDVKGSGTALTSEFVFQSLKIHPKLTNEEPGIGLERLKRGEIAAITYNVGRPAKLFSTIPPGSNLHFLSVPLDGPLADSYLPGTITHADYPALVPDGQSIDTVAVGVALAVFNFAPNTDRYRNLLRFVDTFFTKFPELLQPPHHPKWHDVNLAAQVPGWQRFQPAADWLARHTAVARAERAAPMQAQFDAFLASRGARLPPDQRDQLFEAFTKWLADNGGRRQ
jgi:TRAP transporter TAXI family solute receptor